jgi:hypothetical protein
MPRRSHWRGPWEPAAREDFPPSRWPRAPAPVIGCAGGRLGSPVLLLLLADDAGDLGRVSLVEVKMEPPGGWRPAAG